MDLIQFIGLVILAAACATLFLNRRRSKIFITRCVIIAIIGCGLLLHTRITDISITVFSASFHAKLQEADKYLREIEALKKSAEQQNSAISDVTSNAQRVQSLANVLEADAKKLHETIEFGRLIQLAESDDRPAYEQLKNIGRNLNDPNALIARQTVAFVERQHNGFLERHIQGLTFKDNPTNTLDDYWTSFNLAKPNILKTRDNTNTVFLTLGQLNTMSHMDDIRIGILDHVWSMKSVSLVKRTEFLIKAIESDESLAVVEAASIKIARQWHLKFSPLKTEKFIEWWKENKDKLQDK